VAATAQSASAAHDARQAVPAALHRRPFGQAVIDEGAQVPAPSQLAAEVSVAPRQLCDRHGAPVSG
jgi:hypothetical protein